MHAARLWLILLSYQPPHAPVQSATPSISNAFVDECNDKDFLSTIQKLVGDKTTKKVPAVSPKIILLFVRIVATAANHFGGEFDRMRPLIEAKSPERVVSKRRRGLCSYLARCILTMHHDRCYM